MQPYLGVLPYGFITQWTLERINTSLTASHFFTLSSIMYELALMEG